MRLTDEQIKKIGKRIIKSVLKDAASYSKELGISIYDRVLIVEVVESIVDAFEAGEIISGYDGHQLREYALPILERLLHSKFS